MTRILSIDPAFRKCGIVVINDQFQVEHHENIDFIGEGEKQDQTTYTLKLWRAIKACVNRIHTRFQIDATVIEN